MSFPVAAIGSKPVDAARYFLARAAEQHAALTPMKLLKLVYIAHGWMLGLYGRPLVNEPVEAWQYGPVIPSIYHEYKRFRSSPIAADAAPTKGFDASERSVMDQVFEGYGRRSGVSLSSLTHEPGTPWSITVERSGLGSVIPNDLIEEYYHRRAMQG